MKIPRLLITSGEPAGIGPDLIAQVAQESWPTELCVMGDAALLQTRAQNLGLPLTLLPFDENQTPTLHKPGTLKCFPLRLNEPCEAGTLNSANAGYVIAMLEKAAQVAQAKIVDALVTAPVHKGILNQAGFPFQGHTEFFAEQARLSKALMLFVVQSSLTRAWKNSELKVALLTTHLPLARVPAMLTAEALEQALDLLRQALIQQFQVQDPCIYVCGLNPHAGEGGYLGREEIDVITPVLEKKRRQQQQVLGPLPADTLFTEKYLKKADAVLAMYHDQALPVVKALGFGKAVNVSLGLPYIRTSVDHGTALDLAGTLKAEADSLRAAIQLARDLAL